MSETHIVYFLLQTWSQQSLEGDLVSFIGKWHLENSIQTPEVPIATGEPLPLEVSVVRAKKIRLFLEIKYLTVIAY